MRNRFVKVTRERTNNPPALYHYYKPVELRNGNLYALCNEDEQGADGFAMGLKGFDNAADAWRVIDAIELREAEAEAEAHSARGRSSRDPGREDFHSDG